MKQNPRDLQLMEKVFEVYATCGIQTFPIDCFAILAYYGFRIFTYSQLRQMEPRLYQMCLDYSSDSLTFQDMIAYNERMPMARIRFSLMHELGHWLLDHQSGNKRHEEEADAFASHILAPRILIHKGSCRTAQQIHDTFGLSYSASNRALLDYKLWFQHICQTTRQPSSPEQKLEALFHPIQVDSPPTSISTNSRQKAVRRQSDQELLQQSAFLQAYESTGDYLFRRAEHLKLFGEDL